jgi:hypothetical protein
VKALFTPISIVSGLLAGVVAGRIFKLVWGLIDDEEAPDPEHRDRLPQARGRADRRGRDHPAGARICRPPEKSDEL